MKKLFLVITFLSTLSISAQYTVQPQGFTECVGSTRTIRAVIASWYNNLNTVDWYRNGVLVVHTENTGAGPSYNPNFNENTLQVENLPAGTYTFRCVITNQVTGQSLQSNPAIVTYSNIYPDTFIGIITGPSIVCAGLFPTTFTVPQVNNASFYSWTVPPNATIVSNNGNSITLGFSSNLVQSGNISVSGNTVCGSSNIATFPITVYKSFSSSTITISGSSVICPLSTYTYTVPSDPNVTSYLWTLPSGVIGSSTTNTITVTSTANPIAGNITVQRSNTCYTSTITSFPVTINIVPIAPSQITGITTIYQGQSNVIYVASNTDNTTSYNWTLSGATGTSTTNIIKLAFDNINSSKTISVSGRNFCGNGNSTTINVQVNPSCLPSLVYSSPQNYALYSSITPLTPTNNGGAIIINSAGQVSTLAGNNSSGSIDGNGVNASFNNANDICVDFEGNTYIADSSNNKIRKITPTGMVSTLAGNGSLGTADGVGTAASFYSPLGVTYDASGNIYTSGMDGVRKTSSTGTVNTLFDTNNSNFYRKIAMNNFTNYLYVLNSDNIIYKRSPSGTITNFAAAGNFGFSIALGYSDNIYVADKLSNKILKITPTGVVSTYAGTGVYGYLDGIANQAMFKRPSGVTVDINENVYVTDESNKIRKITPAGEVITLAGNGTNASVDGPFFQSSFNSPTALTVDYLGNNIYVLESNKVRRIRMSGYRINPSLPAGLSFDSLTGIISGTPTVATPSTTYTITAYNEYGNSATIIIISTKVLAPTASSIQNVCGGGNLSNLTVTGTNIKWYSNSIGGTTLPMSTMLISGANYYASQTINGSESIDRVHVQVNLISTPAPSLVNGVSNYYICGNITLAGFPSLGQNTRWYIDGTANLPVQSNTPLFSGNGYWCSQTINGCESVDRTLIMVFSNPIPSTPNVAAIQALCYGTSVSNLLPSGPDVKWYNSITGGVVLNNNEILINGASYYASQINNGCESIDRTITNIQLSTTSPPVAIQNQVFTTGQTLFNLQVTGTNLIWYANQLNATNHINPIINSTLLVNGSTYYVTQKNNGCESAPLSITVTLALGLNEYSNGEIKLYPNPTHSILNLSLNNEIILDKVIVVDITGKVVLEQTENLSTINVEKLAKGVYILTAYAGDNKYQEKFIKE